MGASLDQLRTSADFRAIETKVAAKYDNVVVVIGDKVTLGKSLTGVQDPEQTIEVGRTRYIYIDTSTTSIKIEDGVYKSLSVEQTFAHAMAHAASDLGPDDTFWTRKIGPAELEAINRTNIISQEAGLNGPRDTATPMFMDNSPGPTFPGLRFSNGDDVQRGEVIYPAGVLTAAEAYHKGAVRKIEQEYNDEGETTKITIFGDDDSRTEVKFDQDDK